MSGDNTEELRNNGLHGNEEGFDPESLEGNDSYFYMYLSDEYSYLIPSDLLQRAFSGDAEAAYYIAKLIEEAADERDELDEWFAPLEEIECAEHLYEKAAELGYEPAIEELKKDHFSTDQEKERDITLTPPSEEFLIRVHSYDDVNIDLSNFPAKNLGDEEKALIRYFHLRYPEISLTRIVKAFDGDGGATRGIAERLELEAKIYSDEEEKPDDDKLQDARFLFERAADLGDMQAIRHIGRGKPSEEEMNAPVPEDLSAEELFELAQKYGDPDQPYPNYKKSFECYKRAAVLGHQEAQLVLGNHFNQGTGKDKDYGKAAEWYEKAAAQGNSRAFYYLARLYADGHGVDKDLYKAREFMETSIAKGLGWGEHVLKDINSEIQKTEEHEALVNAANTGDILAQAVYGKELAENHSSRKNAETYLQRPAENGNAESQYYLAKCREDAKDYDGALKWFTKSASQDFGPAQYRLGMYYSEGKHVEQDLPRAFLLFGKAAVSDKDDTSQVFGEDDLETIHRISSDQPMDILRAQIKLADCYFFAKGTKPNYAKAAEWYSKALKHDDLMLIHATGFDNSNLYDKKAVAESLAAGNGIPDKYKEDFFFEGNENKTESSDTVAATGSASSITSVSSGHSFSLAVFWEEYQPQILGILTAAGLLLFKALYKALGASLFHAEPIIPVHGLLWFILLVISAAGIFYCTLMTLTLVAGYLGLEGLIAYPAVIASLFILFMKKYPVVNKITLIAAGVIIGIHLLVILFDRRS